ncbi:hypothetical protein BASA50_009042 [Batrachochytrium salamandrivorans]|uniref:WD repeat-containing protein JIP5 n=1 Tax=Batrachochytrium salamandrivorans TaxID=1357716 RepID=A0ABQ8F5V9_9FUNG|nr:hypothetical protein BASA50_009042 [Batrachochytrium salamandrivorans]
MQTKPIKVVDCGEQVFDLSFHPSRSLVAAGTIEGQVVCFDYSRGDTVQDATLLFNKHIHKNSCRSIDFGVNGTDLFSVSKDRSVQMIDIASGKVKLRKMDAHSDPINIVKSLTENIIATGDDVGYVKIWDTRQRKVIRKYHDSRDFIADFEFDEARNTLLAAGGDGCLSAYNISKNKAVGISANQDDELLSVKLIRNSTKAVIGTQSGALLIFSWGEWGDCTDRFPGHPMSVSSMIKETDTRLFTGSSDGIIRSVSFFPHKLVGAVADTGETMPIEKMRMSYDSNMLATCSHDTLIKFWTAETTWDKSDSDDSASASNDSDSDESSDGDSDEDSDSNNENQDIGEPTVSPLQKSVSGTDSSEDDHSDKECAKDYTQDSDSSEDDMGLGDDQQGVKPNSIPLRRSLPTGQKRPSKQPSIDSDDSSESDDNHNRGRNQRRPSSAKQQQKKPFNETLKIA